MSKSPSGPHALCTALALAGVLVLTAALDAAEPWPAPPDNDALLRAYFAQEVERIRERGDLSQLASAEQWLQSQSQQREELLDMLGLWPLPEKTELRATVIGTLERDGVIVERLHFQSLPGLYVTANLYRPRECSGQLPAVLYLCGHSVQREQIADRTVSYGNKTGYQRHGAWLARHGFVCLTIDTVQWGEILGEHWGTYAHERWDWFARGYTPAGIETWNAIRAVDYLTSRPDVDAKRIGVTGRSGGGAYSWFVAAVDDRIAAAVPVAGITDLQNYVVDGCVEGHCDCMFFVNYHRWDYPQLAAMIAPRPLLIANSDQDPIFPLDGVLRTADQVRGVYELLGARDNLGLLITPGPHQDTPELQVGAFRWLQRHLQGADVLVDEAAVERFERTELRVFTELPSDERVTTADRVLSDPQQAASLPANEAPDAIAGRLRQVACAGWPDERPELRAKRLWSAAAGSASTAASLWEISSQESVVLWAVSEPGADASSVQLHLADEVQWSELASRLQAGAASAPAASRITLVVRGVGPLAWNPPQGKEQHLPRRFYLIGQTVDAMRTWDVLRGLEFTRQQFPSATSPPILTAAPSLQAIAYYAAALADAPVTLGDVELPPDYLARNPLLGAGRIRGLDEFLRALRK